MRDIWENIKDFFTRDWTMTEKVLVILCCILLGICLLYTSPSPRD